MILLGEILSDSPARSLSRDKYQIKREHLKVMCLYFQRAFNKTWLQVFKTLNYFEKNLCSCSWHRLPIPYLLC